MRTLMAMILTALTLLADKKPVPGRTSNDNVGVEATAMVDKQEIQTALGHPLDEGFLIVEVTLTPKNGQTIKINRDDFLLLSQKDGQKATPYAPTQIAGDSGLVISSRSTNAGVMAQQRRVPWGGIGGGPIGGMPMPGGQMGSSTAQTTEAVATVKEGAAQKGENPLLAALKAKILPEKEITEPVTGHLYFLLEGKHKMKDLEFYYKAPGGRLSLKFVR
jgi:hypothetical protein